PGNNKDKFFFICYRNTQELLRPLKPCSFCVDHSPSAGPFLSSRIHYFLTVPVIRHYDNQFIIRIFHDTLLYFFNLLSVEQKLQDFLTAHTGKRYQKCNTCTWNINLKSVLQFSFHLFPCLIRHHCQRHHLFRDFKAKIIQSLTGGCSL